MHYFIDPNYLNQEQPDYDLLFNNVRADYRINYYFRYVYYEWLKARRDGTMMRSFRIDVIFHTGYRHVFTTDDIITLTRNYLGWWLTSFERVGIVEHMRNRKLMSHDFTKWIIEWIEQDAAKS